MGLQRVQHDWATNTSTFFLSCNSTAQSRHGFRQLWLPSHLGLGVFLEFSFSRPTASFGKSCWLYLQSESESEVAQSCLTLFNPWTVAHQAPPSMGFSRQEYWSGFTTRVTWKAMFSLSFQSHYSCPAFQLDSIRIFCLGLWDDLTYLVSVVESSPIHAMLCLQYVYLSVLLHKLKSSISLSNYFWKSCSKWAYTSLTLLRLS